MLHFNFVSNTLEGNGLGREFMMLFYLPHIDIRYSEDAYRASFLFVDNTL